MFVVTAKITKKKIIIGVLAIGVIICGIVMMMPEKTADDVLATEMNQEQMASITVGGIKTNEDRRIFLSDKGLEVSENEIDMKKVQIPSEFDEVYTQYNDMQKAQGFDLEKFKGKTVEMYTYQILNYDDTEDEIHANVLIYKNKIIGGDISSVNLEGFMSGFDIK